MIYGLPRSGTNFLEYLVRNNIQCKYETKYVGGGKYRKGKMALKHSTPDEKHGDYFIILLKTSGNFVKSYRKWSGSTEAHALFVYNDMIKEYLKFYLSNDDRTVIIFHEDLIGNEEKYIDRICWKFGLKRSTDEFVKPKVGIKMDKSGGMSFKGHYAFIDHPEIRLGVPYERIKRLKLRIDEL